MYIFSKAVTVTEDEADGDLMLIHLPPEKADQLLKFVQKIREDVKGWEAIVPHVSLFSVTAHVPVSIALFSAYRSGDHWFWELDNNDDLPYLVPEYPRIPDDAIIRNELNQVIVFDEHLYFSTYIKSTQLRRESVCIPLSVLAAARNLSWSKSVRAEGFVFMDRQSIERLRDE